MSYVSLRILNDGLLNNSFLHFIHINIGFFPNYLTINLSYENCLWGLIPYLMTFSIQSGVSLDDDHFPRLLASIYLMKSCVAILLCHFRNEFRRLFKD